MKVLPVPKLSVLIIDDSENDRYLLQRDLEGTGLNLHIFEKVDGQDALEYFEPIYANPSVIPNNPFPQVIFLDINMPKVDGFAFLHAFSQFSHSQLPTPKVFMLSSSAAREDDKSKALAYGFVEDYLVKGHFGAGEIKAKLLSL